MNLRHSSGQDSDFWPLDYGISAPQYDGKTKNEHFREMLIRAVSDTVLFDWWYVSLNTLRLIDRLQLSFVTTLKSNRLVSVWSEAADGTVSEGENPSEKASWVHLNELDRNAQAVGEGSRVKLKALAFAVRVSKSVATNGDIEWLPHGP